MKLTKNAIYQKLQVLGADIKTTDDAKNKILELDASNNVLRLKSWAVDGNSAICTSLDVDGSEEFNIHVKLYELFSALEAGNEDVKLDVVDGVLVYSSYYNISNEYYEMTVCIPSTEATNEILTQVTSTDYLGKIVLDTTQLLSIKTEFPTEDSSHELTFIPSENSYSVAAIDEDYTSVKLSFDNGIQVIEGENYPCFTVDYASFDLVHGVHAYASMADFSTQYMKVFADHIAYSACGYDIVAKIIVHEEVPSDFPLELTKEQIDDSSNRLCIIEPVEVAGAMDIAIQATKEQDDSDISSFIHLDSSKDYAIIRRLSKTDKIVDTIFHVENENDYGTIDIPVNLERIHSYIKLTGTQYMMLRKIDDTISFDFKNALFTKTIRHMVGK